MSFEQLLLSGTRLWFELSSHLRVCERSMGTHGNFGDASEFVRVNTTSVKVLHVIICIMSSFWSTVSLTLPK